MGKTYTPTSNLLASYNIIVAKPLDTRIVVDTYNDLINPATWGQWDPDLSMWNLFCYQGQVTSVVADSDDSKNGVYYLKTDNYKNPTYATNPGYSMYNDWIRIGGNLFNIDQYTIKDNTDTYSDNDTQVSGLHVVRVDGGDF